MTHSAQKATAQAGSNIAFVKYWGNLDDELRIPMNNSLSMTLDAAFTTTTVTFSDDYAKDNLILNDAPAGEAAAARTARHLDHLRRLAGSNRKARIVSRNSFPTGAGIASSASGFAALTVAAAAALGLDLDRPALSRLARLGSGSACRSIDGGFVEWQQGGTHASSFAAPIAGPDHWELVDIVAIVATGHKAVGSTGGHTLAQTSPFFQARLGVLQTTLPQVRQALLARSLPRLGELIEAEAISLHVAAMTSRPSVLYWQDGTMGVLQGLRRWREEGSEAVGYFTLDAGPNVHIITEPPHVEPLLERLRTLPAVKETIVCRPGGDAHLLDEHLD